MFKCNFVFVFLFFLQYTVAAAAAKLQLVYVHVSPTCVGVKHVTSPTVGVSPNTSRLISGRTHDAGVWLMLMPRLLLLLSSQETACHRNTFLGFYFMRKVENCLVKIAPPSNYSQSFRY